MVNLKKFIRFGVVGSIGFIADAAVLSFLIYHVHWGEIQSRFGSFIVAVSVTWILNRFFTFQPQHKNIVKEYMAYFLANFTGALLNLGVYILLVLSAHGFFKQPLVALTVATMVSMCFNFFAISRYVYI